jgi:uncharacterized protein YidB (DUF937 family)
MTISGIGAATQAWQTSQTQRPRRPDNDQMLSTAADALGLSTSDLKSKLDSGSTLEDVAKTQGVSKDDLVAAIAKDVQAHKPDGAPALSDAQATEMATGIVEGKRPGGPGGAGGHGHGGPPPGPPPGGVDGGSSTGTTQTLSSVADLLGIDAKDLLSRLTSGDTSSLTSATNAWSSVGQQRSSGLLVDQYA